MKQFIKKDLVSKIIFLLVWFCSIISLSVLAMMVLYVFSRGLPHLNLSLFELSYTTKNASIVPSIINTLIIIGISILIVVPIGIFSAIYLVEYAKSTNKLVPIIRLATETLAGIPSIVYGMFGYLFFSIFLGLGYSLIGGSMTLSIMILPVIIRTTEEALKAVPRGYREGSLALGAGKLRTITKVVLPAAIPGITTGVILSIGRIVGETAALILTAGTATESIKSIFDPGRTIAVHMYMLQVEGVNLDKCYAVGVVLLVFMVILNFLSAKLSAWFRKKQMGEL